MKLEEIASTYHAGYVRRLGDRDGIVQTMSFCDGGLIDLRHNNKIIADLGIAMVSPKGEKFFLCDKQGNFMEKITPQEYSKLLGYSK